MAVAAARADLIWYEGFNYTNGIGGLTNVSDNVWTNFSGSGFKDMIVSNNILQVSATGGTLSRADDDARYLATTAGSPYTNTVQLVYASFTIICTNLPNGPGSYFASFYSTSKGFCGRIQAFTNGTILPKTWRLGVTDNVNATNNADGGFPVDLALNTPYQVVEELDPITLQAASIWVNPTNLADTGISSFDPVYTANDSIGFQKTNQINAYAFRQASSFGNSFFEITNLALATTFAEAATNIWTTNAVAPVIAYQPVGQTNYIGNPITISAVANGQGLANLTYQWQQDGVNYTGGNGGTANVLIIPSAATTDSGDFTLIATTAYGLSVTSSVAKVLISNAAVPPAFVAQPVSQSIYNGQTVTFSTSVISPDINSVYYQWKSNGVDIAGANSSTLTLNNVTTGYSGSQYSVGVTNDVTPTGIISTNALLTVLTPQVVSIAYLHTLVDPLNGFVPTNTPPSIPYQVTGTVTTLTNITSGNTSSYYLQDGTGGINIFATLASTFRPMPGDVVTWVGVLSSFTSGLELYADPTGVYPYTSYTDTGVTNALPAADCHLLHRYQRQSRLCEYQPCRILGGTDQCVFRHQRRNRSFNLGEQHRYVYQLGW